MTTSLIDADSLLAIDVGEINTRAMLFDVVDGRYRFLAMGSAQTTANAPYNDIWEGIRMALDRLQTVSGRVLVGEDERLISPTRTDGAGVDKISATISAGKPLRVVAVGLLEDVSLDSARRLAATTYSRVVDSIGLNDRRKMEARVSALQRLRPDLVIVAGGTEGGASQAVHKLLDTVGLACLLQPESQRPEIMYAGNTMIVDEVKSALENIGSIHVSPNVRPTLETEQLDAPQVYLSNLFRRLRGRQIPGVVELDNITGGNLLPTASAMGRVIRFLSQIYDSSKGVLGVDVGASATSVAAAYSGNLSLRVHPQLGLGEGLVDIFQYFPVEDVNRWLSVEVSNEYVRDYLYLKSLYPATLPATVEDLEIEQALARQMLRLAIRNMAAESGQLGMRFNLGMVVGFEPILALGSVLTQAPLLQQSLLILLDGLQPLGVTTFVLDQNHITPALGATAALNPILAVQVLESGALLNMGTIISPMGTARFGTPILRVNMKYDGGNEIKLDVKHGSIVVMPLSIGQTAQLHLRPLHRFDVGMGGAGRGGRIRVTGGALGVVIDARGRPLRLPAEPARRRELFKKWQKALS